MPKTKIALVRLDKMGDLLLTLAADQSLTQRGDEAQICWVINEQWVPILKASEPRRNFIALDLTLGFKCFLQLYRQMVKNNFDQILFIYGPFWAALACFLAAPGRLFGRYSQWWSYLLLTKGLRQKRSLAEKHEYQYNVELVNLLYNKDQGMVAKIDPLSPTDLGQPLTLKAPRAPYVLEKHGLHPHSYWVVHPGMAGSARNWSLDHYISLIQELAQKDPVVITGTLADQSILKPLKEALKDAPDVLFLDQQLNLEQLLYVLATAKGVLAPSTGVAHLAACLGQRLVALYPNHDTTTSPKRWAPLGKQVQVFTGEGPQLEPLLPVTILKALTQRD